MTLDVAGYDFYPVIALPRDYEVYDFTRGYDPNRTLASPYGIGRYDEKRVAVYTTALFAATGGKGARDVHMGIDLAAPAGTAVHAFWEGTIHAFADNDAPGDYGPTIVTHHVLGGRDVWALFGHLSRASLGGRALGARVERGAILGHVGEKHENGGWNPHVHVQLALVRPERADLPGAVADEDREAAKAMYPDPRLVLGPLY
jgi:murein DD-endopeptidase MepM/ murein hydrolase activator NlpD